MESEKISVYSVILEELYAATKNGKNSVSHAMVLTCALDVKQYRFRKQGYFASNSASQKLFVNIRSRKRW
jgi:hypothetical protein